MNIDYFIFYNLSNYFEKNFEDVMDVKIPLSLYFIRWSLTKAPFTSFLKRVIRFPSYSIIFSVTPSLEYVTLPSLFKTTATIKDLPSFIYRDVNITDGLGDCQTEKYKKYFLNDIDTESIFWYSLLIMKDDLLKSVVMEKRSRHYIGTFVLNKRGEEAYKRTIKTVRELVNGGRFVKMYRGGKRNKGSKTTLKRNSTHFDVYLLPRTRKNTIRKAPKGDWCDAYLLPRHSVPKFYNFDLV